MRFLTNASTDPWYNLSFDEYCLEQYPSDDSFFYLWRNRPSVIVGLNQNVCTEVNLDYLDAHGRRCGGWACRPDCPGATTFSWTGARFPAMPAASAATGRSSTGR